MVFNSSSFRYPLPNVTVFVISDRFYSADGLTFSQDLTNSDGHACLPVSCNDYANIFVETNQARIPAANLTFQRQFLPPFYPIQHNYFDELILFHANVWGTFRGKTGPVYEHTERNVCTQTGKENYQFLFAYVSYPDQLYSTPLPVESQDPVHDLNAWRYGIMDSDKQTCYFKVSVKVTQITIVSCYLIIFHNIVLISQTNQVDVFLL